MLVPENQEQEVDEMIARLRAGERVGLHDARRRRKDGSEVDVSISMSAVRDRKGTLVGVSKVIRDITERKQNELALASAKEEAEVTSQAFEAFSYSVAHDLRAPLRAINGFSQMLAIEYSGVLDDEGRQYLDRVQSSARRMEQLIESLLQLARITHRELAAEVVDLSELSRAIVDQLRQDAPDRDVDFVVQPDLMARGDAVLLANAMDNLLRNAWKFTSDCQDARIEFGRASDGYFIRDNGAGFDMAYSEKLFGVFQRLHSTEQFAGTGVGLATVQRIIERHQGRIWAEGTVGSGATFHFTLGQSVS
jgi:light-regulated signal transduction histidine kinase (bacteriophytochrome)